MTLSIVSITNMPTSARRGDLIAPLVTVASSSTAAVSVGVSWASATGVITGDMEFDSFTILSSSHKQEVLRPMAWNFTSDNTPWRIYIVIPDSSGYGWIKTSVYRSGTIIDNTTPDYTSQWLDAYEQAYNRYTFG